MALELFFDGFCEVNPGTTGSYGVVIKEDKEIIKTLSGKISGAVISSNIAEYKGLLAGLEYLFNNGFNQEEIRVFGDSMLVIKQMNKEWRIKKGLYKEIALEAKEMIKQFGNIFFEWIPREKNKEADSLSKIC